MKMCTISIEAKARIKVDLSEVLPPLLDIEH